MKTKVFNEQFKGHNMFAIYEVDDAGNKLDPNKPPFLSFGAKKAFVLQKHKDELDKFVAANQPQMPTPANAALDMTKLSAEEQAKLVELLGKAK